MVEIRAERVVAPAGRTTRRREWLRGLFEPAPVGPDTRAVWRRVTVAVAGVALGTAVSLWRQAGAGALDTIWAEDGKIFLGEAARDSTVDTLTTSYQGYFHTAVRLLAEIASLVPPEAAATTIAVLAALTTSLMAVLVYFASAAHLPDRLSRLLVSAVILVVPVGLGDLPNSIANLHWAGLYTLFWMLVWTPRGRTTRVVATAVVALVALSDILTLVFVPLALLRALRRDGEGRRDRMGLSLAAALGAGLAVQFFGLLVGSSSRELAPDPVRAVVGYVVRAVPGALIGERWLGDESHIDQRWLVLAGVAWLIVAAAVVVVWRRATRPQWPLAVVAVLHSAALYVLPVFLSGTATARYVAAPAMLLVAALVALLQPPDAMPRAWAPIGALALILCVVWAANLRTDNIRGDGPRWSDQLTRARLECAGTGEQTVTIRIPPLDAPWEITLPCSYVRRS